MFKLEQRLQNFKPYEPDTAEYRIRFDVNESFIKPDKGACERFASKLSAIDFNRYPDPYCFKLTRLYADYLGVNENQVVVGNGSDELLSLIATAFLKDNGKVLTLKPDFPMYKFYSSLRRAEVCEEEKKGTLAEIAKKVKPDIIFFSNPCNPTGAVIKKEEVLNLLKETSALVVADEAYMDFCGESVVSYTKDFNNLIVTRTLSKAGGIASARVGFAVANEETISVLKAVKSPYNVNALSQAFAEAVLEDKEQFLKNIALIKASKESLFKGLSAIKTVLKSPFTPQESGANFIYIKTDKSGEIKQLLKEKGMAVRAFEGFLRINAGSESENKELLEVLNENS
ncbi:MAG: histidinol-phosphate transaminase [Firmicutes bacterium]|nr:histidinol-phosphate transaminase [Bacillota bacterium]